MKDIQTYYDELSRHYDTQRSNPYFRLIEELELEALRRAAHSTQGGVLEVGCGTGIFLKHLQDTDGVLHGLDYTSGMLKVAQHKMGNTSARLVRGDAQTLPYASDSFDVVYSFKVLAHLPHIDWALAEVRRVLRSDGIAVLEFYNRHSIRHLLYRGGYFHQWHSPNKIRQQLETAHLSVVSTYGARIVTPFAQALEIPGISNILRYAEKRLAPTTCNRFAGYYIVICRPQ